MQTLSSSVDRLGAALRAARETHADPSAGTDKLALGAKCLQVVITQLAGEGLSREDLQPLIDLEAGLVRPPAPRFEGSKNRRKRQPPSDAFLARVSAVIDLLVKAGTEEGEAAQVVMRWLLAAGVPAPRQGPDARGWKRLLAWRTRLMHGLVSEEAKSEYQDFTRQLETIPAGERVKRVLDEQLWDRRRGDTSSF